jgi:hypothetical protein
MNKDELQEVFKVSATMEGSSCVDGVTIRVIRLGEFLLWAIKLKFQK